MDTQAEPQVDTGLRVLITLTHFYQIPAEEPQIRDPFWGPTPFLNTQQVLAFFCINYGKVQEKLRSFVVAGLNQRPLCYELKNHSYLCSDECIDEVKSKAGPNRSIENTPRLQKIILRNFCPITRRNAQRENLSPELVMMVILRWKN